MNATVLGVTLALVCAVVEGFGQMLLKKAARPGARSAGWIALGVAFFLVQGLLYIGAINFIEVSTAFPISSVSLVVAILMSRWMLGEAVTRMRWLGVALILVGTSFVAASV